MMPSWLWPPATISNNIPKVLPRTGMSISVRGTLKSVYREEGVGYYHAE